MRETIGAQRASRAPADQRADADDADDANELRQPAVHFCQART
ncbi:MAG TPA: hypothetical protein VL242_42065 [Sorangium sp.]|nr:hypothetical protein [Sorangium sp.]